MEDALSQNILLFLFFVRKKCYQQQVWSKEKEAVIYNVNKKTSLTDSGSCFSAGITHNGGHAKVAYTQTEVFRNKYVAWLQVPGTKNKVIILYLTRDLSFRSIPYYPYYTHQS